MIFSRRAFLASTSAAALSGCSEPVLTIPETISLKNPKQVDLVAVTNRAWDLDENGQQTGHTMFSHERSNKLSFQSFKVSVPADKGNTRFSFNNKRLNQEKNYFVMEKSAISNDRAVLAGLKQRVEAKDGKEKNVFAIVHGYNVSYPGAVFRAVQIAEDLGIEDEKVLFSWPSGGSLTSYAYDRDSVLFSRDDAANSLRELAKNVQTNIIIVAHSMGCFLTMETLRQLALKDDTDTLKRIVGVILVHGDVDVDVFLSQLETVRGVFSKEGNDTAKAPGFVVAFSQDDQVLKVSRSLAKRNDRIGNIENFAKLQAANVTTIDVSEKEAGKAVQKAPGIAESHTSFLESSALTSILKNYRNLDLIFQGEKPTEEPLPEGVDPLKPETLPAPDSVAETGAQNANKETAQATQAPTQKTGSEDT